jgi:hypothetical protein
MTCRFHNCTRVAGHEGPHGIEAHPGLIFAPYGGGEGNVEDETLTDLACDCCGLPMTMCKYSEGGGQFACACGQRWRFTHSEASATILARLYPSRMDEQAAIYDEFLDHWLTQVTFHSKALVLCGLRSTTDAESDIAKAKQRVSDKRLEIETKRQQKAGKSWFRRFARWAAKNGWVGPWERGE